MRDPAFVTEDGHPGSVDHGLAQACPAAWDDRVERLTRSDQLERDVFLWTVDQYPSAIGNPLLLRRLP